MTSVEPALVNGPPMDAHADLKQEVKDDVAFLTELIALYCEQHHGSRPRREVERRGRAGAALPAGMPMVCDDCRKLLLHGVARRLACPHNPKPACRNCQTPCHHPDYRSRLAKIMRWEMTREEKDE